MDKPNLKGSIIALTGKLSKPSDQYGNLIAINGGTYVTTVTKKTTHLVTNDIHGTSDKLQKARKNGTIIWSEEDLIARLTLMEPSNTLPQSSEGDKMAKMPEMLLAEKYDSAKHNTLRGWWVSEKLDGVRSWWDGEHFWSRLGNKFHAPNWFKKTMPPNIILDGELFIGRKKFNETVSIVKTHASDQAWKRITFMVFDIPSEGKKPFEDRLALLRALCQDRPHMKMVDHKQLNDENVDDMLKDIETIGGEGLMFRQPRSTYIGKRSKSLLKMKSFHDEEAKIIGYGKKGKGRLEGTIGSFEVMDGKGIKFEVGSGLTDEIRKNPPPIGTLITFKYQEKIEKTGRPRFPVYVGPAIDKKLPA